MNANNWVYRPDFLLISGLTIKDGMQTKELQIEKSIFCYVSVY
jgi:hypothetical protein